jgi:hypothetical protein
MQNNPADARVCSYQTRQAPKLLSPSSQQQVYHMARDILLMTNLSPEKPRFEKNWKTVLSVKMVWFVAELEPELEEVLLVRSQWGLGMKRRWGSF